MKINITNTPKTKPLDENSLGFGKIFTDHMIVKKYSDGAWGESQIVPYGTIALDPSSACLHYGQEVFEGLKAYRNTNNDVFLFRPEENFKRLNLSCERMGIPKIDENEALADLKELLKIEKDWIPTSDGTSLYIRPYIIATESGLGVHPSNEYLYVVILSPSGMYYKNGLSPVSIYVEDEYVRAIKGGTGMAKTGGNYAASLIAQERANALGFDQVLWLDGALRKYVEEVGAMNVFFVLKNRVVTPELSGSILAGVTRKSTIDIIRSLNIDVCEEKITIDELIEAYQKGELLEAFGTGTAAVISPIGKLKYKDTLMELSNGEIGVLSQKVYDTLTGIQYGKIDDSFGYIQKV